jgi:hypothetical protein
VDNHLWQPLDTASDPYAARLVDGAGCDYTSFLVEGADPPVLEVLTLICDFLTLSQPSLVDLAEGDALRIVVSHGPLAAPDSSPAEGFVAVRVGDTEIWTTTVPLPSTQSQSFQAEWIADRDYPAATPIAFHVDNHGTNSWRLLEITRLAR